MTNGDAQERMVVVEVSQVELREQIIRVEGRMDVLETRMDSLETRMDRLEARMGRLEAKIDRLLYGMVAITIANVGAIVAVIAT